MIKRAKKTIDVLINGRDNYPPSVQRYLKKNGNNIIKSIRIIRSPINAMINSVLDILITPCQAGAQG